LGGYYSSGEAKASWADGILNDAQWCINTMKGLQTTSPAGTDNTVPPEWNEDIVKVHDIWSLLSVVGSSLPTPLNDPLDSKFDYLSLVNDRPWMWNEERATPFRDRLVLTNHVVGDEDTVIREFADAPPTEWFAGFGTWALTRVKSVDLLGASNIVPLVAANSEYILYGEIDPFVLNGTDSYKVGEVENGAAMTDGKRPQPFYVWFNRADKWQKGLQDVDNNVLGQAGSGSVEPTGDPLLNRNVNLIKAARILDSQEKFGKYPINRPYMMDIGEQNLDDLSNGWLQVMSEALMMPES
jgi:hypothetical protein